MTCNNVEADAEDMGGETRELVDGYENRTSY
jgi:hypothetical protein